MSSMDDICAEEYFRVFASIWATIYPGSIYIQRNFEEEIW